MVRWHYNSSSQKEYVLGLTLFDDTFYYNDMYLLWLFICSKFKVLGKRSLLSAGGKNYFKGVLFIVCLSF